MPQFMASDSELSTDQAWGDVAAGATLAGLVIGAAWTMSKFTSPDEDELDPLLLAKRDTEEDCQDGSKRGRPGAVVFGAPGAAMALLFAIPSIVGSCCWPLLLVTAFGVSGNLASTEYREVAHHITFGVDLVLFGFVLWYLATRTPNRKTTPPTGPFWVAFSGVILAMIDPTRHMVLDHGGLVVEPEKLAMYADGHGNLSAVGELCRWCTIIGLTLISVGVMWFLGILGKARDAATGEGTA